MKKLIFLLKHYYWFFIAVLCSPLSAIADNDDPFPSIQTSGGDVVQTTGTHMEVALKYTLVGAGGLLIIICLAVIIHRLREDNREKDHGNLIMTFILLISSCNKSY